MRKYISFRDFDWVLLLFVLLICFLGVVQIYSATLSTKFAGAHVKQLYWIAGGLLLMFLVSLVNYETVLDRIHWLYGFAALALVAVLIPHIGQKYMGARRWIPLGGGIHFQPSEWVKLILILVLAKYFSDLRQRDASFADVIKAGLIGGIPLMMVLVQPDLGTALSYIPIILMALFLGGIQLRHAVAIVVIGAVLAVPAFRHLKPYQ